MGSRNLESSTPPIPLAHTSNIGGKPQPLTGIRVLELCIIMAGSTIGRIPAEYGADVIKVTTSSVSDVPFFQVDGNKGKPTLDLKLRSCEGRSQFKSLLQTIDIIIDGYRPGSLTQLGYGPLRVREVARSRNKGIIYIAESQFGALPPSLKVSFDTDAEKWA